MAYCRWDSASELNIRYHDEEWGVPLHDDRGQFEFLMMEVMQCGLNWNMMMQKREIFRSCFDNFEFDRIAEYTEADIERIMNTTGMIRSRRKIEAVISNARCFQHVREELGTFSKYLWAFSGGKTIIYDKHQDGYIPVSNGLSDKISKDLKKGASSISAASQSIPICRPAGSSTITAVTVPASAGSWKIIRQSAGAVTWKSR